MPPELEIQPAVAGDVEMLAGLNKQLLEDENNRFQPGLGELTNRMAGWVAGQEWTVDLFTEGGGAVVGYLVHGRRFNPAAPGGDEIYIRQFAIDRAFRRQGAGRAAIALFLERRCVPGMRVMLDVLETNPAGRAFWSEIGFAPYATIMTLKLPQATGPTD